MPGAPATIRAPLEGAQPKDALGDLRAHRGCRCEIAPASDEYDYLPRPHIAAVGVGAGSAQADEHGGTLVVIQGSGLNSLDLDWVDFGSPRSYAAEHSTYEYATGTELVVRALGDGAGGEGDAHWRASSSARCAHWANVSSAAASRSARNRLTTRSV